MGYNQNHAGIHPVPRGSKGTMNFSEEKNKYGMLIGEYRTKNTRSDSEILQDVKICNFVVLTNVRGEVSACLCGGRFKSLEKIPVRYHNIMGKMETVQLDGKQCVDCGRKLFVKSDIIKSIRKMRDVKAEGVYGK